MAQYVRRYKTDSGVRALAQAITKTLPPANTAQGASADVTAIQHFVRDKIRYVGDVEGVETLQTAVYTLKSGSGDCDDKAILVNTLLSSIGYPTLFYYMGVQGSAPCHVTGGVKLGTREIPLETIIPGAEPGWLPPDATAIKSWHY